MTILPAFDDLYDVYETDLNEISNLLTKKQVPSGTRIYQAEYIPSGFPTFLISVIVTKSESQLNFKPFCCDAVDLEFELAHLHDGSTGEGRQQHWKLFKTGRSPRDLRWSENANLTPQVVQLFENKLDQIRPQEMHNDDWPQNDGISGRGRVIDLGNYANEFFSISPYKTCYSRHYDYFLSFLNLASEHLKNPISLDCIKELKEYF